MRNLYKSKVPCMQKTDEGKWEVYVPRDGCTFEYDTREEAEEYIKSSTGSDKIVFYED